MGIRSSNETGRRDVWEACKVGWGVGGIGSVFLLGRHVSLILTTHAPSLCFVKETTCFETLRVVDSSCSWSPVNDQIETRDVKLPTRGPVWDDPNCESLSQSVA